MGAKDWAKVAIGTAGVVAGMNAPMNPAQIRAAQEKARVEQQRRELEAATRRRNEERRRSSDRRAK